MNIIARIPIVDRVNQKWVKEQGLKVFYRENSIGITPLDYLSAKPCTDSEINQRAIAKRFIFFRNDG